MLSLIIRLNLKFYKFGFRFQFINNDYECK